MAAGHFDILQLRQIKTKGIIFKTAEALIRQSAFSLITYDKFIR